MTAQRFPARRDDGTAEVAAVFQVSSADTEGAVERALAQWHDMLGDVDLSADLSGEPLIEPSSGGFRVLFRIRSGSRLWRDWAVALISCINEQLETDSFVGFFDAVAGRMHQASRWDLLGDNGTP